MKNPKKKRFKLLDPMRDGKGVEKGEDTRPTLRRFFKLWGRKFWKLVELNAMMLVQVIPIAVCVFLYIAGPKIPTQHSLLYPALLGAQTALPTSAGMTLFNGVAGLEHTIPIYHSWAHYVMAAMIILLLVTYGWQKVGSVYILRNLVRGDGVFLFSDYFYAIRRNLKQGFLMGLFDCAVCGILAFNIYSYSTMAQTGFNGFLYAATIALIIIYGIMRFYTYLMLVTFDMKFSKILKNALIFTALGIRRNLMAILGMGVLIGVCVLLYVFLMPFKVYAVMLIPALCLLGFSGFMYTFAAYPVIEKYMIAPVTPKAVTEAETEE